MNFFKTIFGAKTFVPTPTQNIPGLEPIVVFAVENLFPNVQDQREVFTDLLEKSEIYNHNPLVLLSILYMGEGKMEEQKRIMEICKNSVDSSNIIRDSGFFKMKDAEKWVESIVRK